MKYDKIYFPTDLLTEFQKSAKDFSFSNVYFEILMLMEYKNVPLTTTYSYFAQRFKVQEIEVKKTLLLIKEKGFIEIYRGHFPNCIKIVLRKLEELSIDGEEIYFDENDIVSTISYKSRLDKGYSKFRKAVLERDNYTCQLCGAKDNLEVHHKKSYAKYPKLRTNVNNGITLCEKCHDNVHSKEVVL